LQSSTFKVVLLDLYKQEEILADDALTYFSASTEVITADAHQRPFHLY